MTTLTLEEFSRLPLSEAVRLAVVECQLIEQGAVPGVVLNMSVWGAYDGIKCAVCMAGACMVGVGLLTIEAIKERKQIDLSEFAEGQQPYNMLAINSVREGNIEEAVRYWYGAVPNWARHGLADIDMVYRAKLRVSKFPTLPWDDYKQLGYRLAAMGL